jgi:hypothetical protein
VCCVILSKIAVRRDCRPRHVEMVRRETFAAALECQWLLVEAILRMMAKQYLVNW